MLSTLFEVIAPVFVCAALGFGWARSGARFDTEMVANLVAAVGVPALIVSTLLKAEVAADALLAMGGAVLAVFVVTGAIFWAGLRGMGLDRRAYLPGLVFANTGNMGLPLCLLAFGAPGLALAIVHFTIHSVLLFSAGVAVASGAASVRALARMPTLYAVVAAVALMATGTALPAWIATTVNLLGGMTIPLMLITLGIALAKLRAATLGRATLLAVARLGIGLAVGLGVAELFGLEGAARGVLVVQSAMPVAAFAYLLAQRYGTRPEEVAGMVLVSTAISFATLPGLLWLVL